jgi:type I restriction enzyme S subunit
MDLKPGYKQTEVGVIPEEWEVGPVRQKGEVVTGKALAAHAPGRQRPYLRTRNVFDGRIDIGDVLTMPMTDEQFEQFQVREGDVLLNEGQSLELVGRCSLYQGEYPEPCAIQNALLRFRAREGVSGKFASYLFRHCQQTGVFARIALQTTAIAHLGGSRFERLRLPWPTESEQRAIAAALSDVEALLGSLDRLLAKKRDVKQAAMQQLLTGQTRLPGLTGEWKVKSFRQVFDFLPTATNSRADQDEDGDAFYIHYGDIHTRFNGHLDFTKETPPRIRRKLCRNAAPLRNGDWVMADASEDFDGVGKSIEILGLGGDEIALAGLHTFLLREKRPTFAPGFKGHLGGLRSLHEEFLRVATGMKVFGVSKAALRDLLLPIPPVAEQTAIAAVLSDMDAELAALEQRRDKTRALKQGMMQELLTGRTRLV